MKKLENLCKKYIITAKLSIKNFWTYKSNIVPKMLILALFIFIQSRIWKIIYATNAIIDGYTFTKSVWYFMFAEISIFSFSNIFNVLSEDIKNGKIAYALLRPYNFITYSFFEQMAPGFISAIIFFIEGFFLCFLFTGSIPFESIIQILFLLVSFILAGLLTFLLQLCISFTAFFVEENSAFHWIFNKIALVVGTLLPIEFLPSWLQEISYMTPFPYITYAYSRIAVSFNLKQAFSLIGMQCLWICISLFFGIAVYNLGRKNIVINGG